MKKGTFRTIAEKTARVTAKTTVRAAKAAANVGARIAIMDLPQSLNWLFGLGFKVGLLLSLKSILVLRFQLTNLSCIGKIMLLCQSFLAFSLMFCGVNMQSPIMYENPYRIRRISRFYLYAGLLNWFILLLKSLFNISYFVDPNSINWFVDFFSKIFSSIKEFGLTVLFVDGELWAGFCILLFVISYMYLNATFSYKDSPMGDFIYRLGGYDELEICEEDIMATSDDHQTLSA